MSTAVGAYVSVGSQCDAEQADVGREKRDLAAEPRYPESEDYIESTFVKHWKS